MAEYTPDPGALVITGIAPTRQMLVNRLPAAGTVTITGVAPALLSDRGFSSWPVGQRGMQPPISRLMGPPITGA